MTARPKCSAPGCTDWPAAHWVKRDGRLRWVNVSDRCVRHERQRPPPKPVSVEDFEPLEVL